jgi:hypothetical protein
MNVNTYRNPCGEVHNATIDLGFGELNVLPFDCTGALYTITNITEKEL